MKRRAIHAYVSEAAHDQWHQFAAVHGVSVSALLEALADTVNDVELHHLEQRQVLDRAVDNSRQIDAKRRRRVRK